MAEAAASGSGSVSQFWHKGLEKISGKGRGVKNVPGSEDGKAQESDGVESHLTPKQRRRAQVRKAQIEHRQRKETHQRDLEQEIVNLREMIATATTQSVLFKHENLAIRHTLSKSGVPVTLSAVPISTPSTLSTAPTPAIVVPDLQQGWTESGQSLVSGDSSWPMNSTPSLSTSGSSLVSIGFDDVINASCLRISSPNFLFPSNEDLSMFGIDPSTTTDAYPTSQMNTFSLEEPTQTRPAVVSEDLETTAINFILALESPCRAHFHGHPIKPDGTTGHEMMASTLLYTSAPQTVFDHPDFRNPPPIPHPTHCQPDITEPSENPYTQWKSPTLRLRDLEALSSSLPKSDWEITPVQAWFKLASTFSESGSEGLLRNTALLDKLKRGITPLVDCFHFGAVLDEGAFWGVVNEAVSGGGDEGGAGGVEVEVVAGL